MSSRLMWILKPVMQPWRVTDRKKKKLPERGIALSKWVIEYCDKGNQNVQLKSKLPLPWWNWTLLLEKHPHAHETMHTNKRESQIKVAVGHWTREMNYEGWNTEATELTSCSETFGPLTESTLAYLAEWIELDPASERSREQLLAIAILFCLVFYFPIFFKVFPSKAYVFYLFIWNVSLFLSRNRHSRSRLPKHRVCLSFSALRKGGSFNYSRMQFIDIVTFDDRVFKFRINKI